MSPEELVEWVSEHIEDPCDAARLRHLFAGKRLVAIQPAPVSKGDDADEWIRKHEFITSQTISEGKPGTTYTKKIKVLHSDEVRAYVATMTAADGMVSVPMPEPRLLGALKRFQETTEDEDTYDIDAATMAELAELGVVRRHGATTYYHTTKLGTAILQVALSPAQPDVVAPTKGSAVERDHLKFCFFKFLSDNARLRILVDAGVLTEATMHAANTHGAQVKLFDLAMWTGRYAQINDLVAEVRRAAQPDAEVV